MEFFNSLFKSVNERLTSPLYGALLIATIIWNYDIFLTIFFVDNEAILKITGDKLMKSTYIHDFLFTNVPVIWSSFYQNLPYLYSWFYRIIPVLVLTWLFITQVPKIANKAHEKEREFMRKREEKNIDYDEKISEYKFPKLVKINTAAQLELEIERTKEASKNLKKTNASHVVNEVENDGGIQVGGGLDEYENNIYQKIKSDSKTLNNFIKMLQFIDKKNEKQKTANSELGIKYDLFKDFNSFYSSDLISATQFMQVNEDVSKYYLYFKDEGKRIALQMVKDGYIKEEDLIGKV